jgi:hypothetical protein
MDYQNRREEYSWLFLLGGLAVGALAMFVVDPSQGSRRRSQLQDKMSNATNKTSKLMDRFVRDAHNRLLGLQAQARRIMAPKSLKPIDNHVLEARVRSRMGREIPQFDDVHISAREGTISLSGNISAEEESRLLEMVEAIPGVEALQHNLEIRSANNSIRRAGWSVMDTVSVVCAVSAGLAVLYRLTRDRAALSEAGDAASQSLSENQLDLPQTESSSRESKKTNVESTDEQVDRLH